MPEKDDSAKMSITFNDITFRDVDEYIMDMKNIFAQMIKTYQNFVENTKTYVSKTDLDKMKEKLKTTLSGLQQELKERLDYITDSNKVDPEVVGDKKTRLIQLKSLNESIDISKNTLDNLQNLLDFYNKRVLDKTISTQKGIISRKKNSI